MPEADDELQESLAALLPRLLAALDRLEFISRHMDVDADLDDTGLTAALDRIRAASWPDQLTPFRDQLVLAGESAQAVDDVYAQCDCGE